jgi:tetratricopeptide (TPR) repeat protein
MKRPLLTAPRHLPPSWLVIASCAVLLGCPKKPDVDPKTEAAGHYFAGQAAYLKGSFVEAHKEFDEARRLDPDDPRLPIAEGELFLGEGRVDDALARFEAAAQKDPKRATTWSRLGYLYSVKKQGARAHEALDKALALNPKDFNALESLADLQLEVGDAGTVEVDAAVANLVKAADVAPERAAGELLLKATAALSARGRQVEALALLEAAVGRGTKTPEVLNELAERLVQAARLADAVTIYRRAAEADPRDPTLWELVGELEARLSHPAEARAAFGKSLAVKDRGVVHVALARLCLSQKDSECVKRELDLALAAASGEELRETLDLADLLATLDRKKDALTLLRSVSEEADQKTNFALHLKTARLAKDLSDEVTVKAACTRALASGQAGLHCP